MDPGRPLTAISELAERGGETLALSCRDAGVRVIGLGPFLLVHLPITIWIPGLIVGTDLSVGSRMLIGLTATTLVGFVSYDFCVRSSIIGRVLNGRRYPRGLPAQAEAA